MEINIFSRKKGLQLSYILPNIKRDFTSGSHVGHAQWYLLYYYYCKKKSAGTGCACPRDHFRSGSLPVTNRQTSGESASLPQYLGCNTVFDMRLRVRFPRRKPYHFNQTLRTANKF